MGIVYVGLWPLPEYGLKLKFSYFHQLPKYNAATKRVCAGGSGENGGMGERGLVGELLGDSKFGSIQYFTASTQPFV